MRWGPCSTSCRQTHTKARKPYELQYNNPRTKESVINLGHPILVMKDVLMTQFDWNPLSPQGELKSLLTTPRMFSDEDFGTADPIFLIPIPLR